MPACSPQTNTGLLLSTTRAYDPANGHWLNRDPKREAAAGENQFSYTPANPIKWNDPMGTDVIKEEYLPNPSKPRDRHGLIIVTEPGGDRVIRRQSYGWDETYLPGEPNSGLHFWPLWPDDKTHPRNRIVTSPEENELVLDVIDSFYGKRGV